MSAHAVCAAQATLPPETYQALYFRGDAEAALVQAQRAFDEAAAPDGKSLILLDIAYICVRTDDVECLSLAMRQLVQEQARLPAAAEAGFRQRVQAWLFYTFLWSGDAPQAERIAAALQGASVYDFDHVSYLVLQEGLASQGRAAHDYEAARRAASRLIARLVLFDGMSKAEQARYLASVVGLFDLSGDSESALRFAGAFTPFIAENLPRSSIEFATYVEVTAHAAGSGLTPAAARASLRLADGLVGNLRIPAAKKTAWLSALRTTQTSSELLAGDIAAAVAAQQRDPLVAQRAEILRRGRFETPAEVTSEIVEVLVKRAAGQALDTRFAPLFAQPFGFTLVGYEPDYLEAYRLFGKAAFALGRGADGFSDLLNAARIRLQTARLLATSGGALFPLPDLADRIAVGSAIEALSVRGAATAEEQNLVLAGLDYLQRNARQTRSDALEYVSSVADPKARRLAQANLQLSARRRALELDAVQRVITGRAGDRAARFDLARAIAELSAERMSVRPAAPAASASFAWGASDIAEIRKRLRPREALVTDAVFFGNLYKLCVSADQFLLLRMAGTPELFANAASDIRLLRLALTATHAPSDQLDAQYPVAAALRVKTFVLGGLEPCLVGVTHLSYVPMSELADIPLQALLDAAPPQQGNGYNLAQARWLLHRFDVSYLSSVREFVAAHRLADGTGGALPFLGVGDPVLAGRAGAFASLVELPETAAELQAIHALLPDARTLTREDATEARVREEPLGAFNVLSFATHGLIKGEVDGIEEPGLVLAQEQTAQQDATRDGFLSATELAAIQLNARLVVLSACNTANIDPALFAPQVRGLAEALAIAGVPVTVASLWTVDSDVTRELMTGFFAELAADPAKPIVTAFGDAVRKFLRNPSQPAFHHPRFWGGFGVFGVGNIALLRASAGGPKLVAAERQANLGGEILAAIPLPGGDTIIAGNGDWDGGRLTSFVRRQEPGGNLAWQLRDGDLTAERIHVAADRIYAGGYRRAADGALFTPAVRALDMQGRVLWQWAGTPIAAGDAVVPVLSADSQGRLLLLLNTPNPDNMGFALTLLRFDARGGAQQLWRLASVAIAGDQVKISPLLPARDGIFLLVSFAKLDAPAAAGNDGFGLARICGPGSTTAIFLAPIMETAPQLVGAIDHLALEQAKLVDGRPLLAGRMQPACAGAFDGAAWFGELTRTAVTPLYVERQLPRSRIRDFAQAGNRLLLAGDWVHQHAETRSRNPNDNVLTQTFSDANYETREVFVMEIPAASTAAVTGEPPVQFLSSGMSVMAGPILADGPTVKLWAIDGTNILTARYDWPP
jgi:hypothetical protein